MSTNAPPRQSSTDPRPDYFPLGTDADGIHHVRDVHTATVHLVHPDGSRERKIVPDGRLGEYMDAVESARGWRSTRYSDDPLFSGGL